MTHETVGLSGVPNMGDGQVSATILDAVLDAERAESILHLARRIDRLRCKTEKHLANARAELDEALQGHPLEDRLRTRFFTPLEDECTELARVFQRVQCRLSLFTPAQSQKQFEDCMALQLEDIQAERAASDAEAPCACTAPELPFGYWMSEDSYNRLRRARWTALMLSGMGDGMAERMALSFESMAASTLYIHEDLAAVMNDATHSTELVADDASC
ncbi:TPA: hypothetical protein HH295_16170 [Xanthomonas vasicola pv. zeae]|uniref:Uncharacterized protein n=3 Tax=Xanthomonas vasicola TaxID=56459 RepID=A0A836P6Y1_XANVA|nr:hypothetical protein [Xanthomonas vasicola]AVQ08443.1 hypothetical protein C7V42_19425 [Xanthomonas vasicola pv. vasculorum]AZM72639.1 hypothetical protein CXP37_19440 [Xanthomonas vasicola pv. vasculorum]KFA32598.1 hypothetical protein KW5_0100125 [Xanthomonas vasicola pv. vasculorum NCPPB 1326]KFA36380.1 hypothetical protein KWG_0100600 [Xanthomonas vasicola pv. vasculorum NCPPB 1381]MBV6748042.1 hypothetical protein [Xanthomonas vasicola pv. vasculorum NCPPB 890]